MGITAEKLGDKYGITRAECDEFATRSQNLSEKATAAGVLQQEIEPIEVKGRKGKMDVVSTDEAIRNGCQLGDLTKLKSVFRGRWPRDRW